MANGKSPDEDAFTVEFYKCCFDFLGQDLLNSFNAAYDNGGLSVSQRRGVITLIPEENADLRELSKFMASKAIATRIKKFLPKSF